MDGVRERVAQHFCEAVVPQHTELSISHARLLKLLQPQKTLLQPAGRGTMTTTGGVATTASRSPSRRGGLPAEEEQVYAWLSQCVACAMLCV
jgi:hypothetical protein